MEAAGAFLRAFRDMRGLGRGDIGQAVGATPNTVGTWERGETPPDIISFDIYCEVVRAPIAIAMELVRDKTATPMRGMQLAAKYFYENEDVPEDELTKRIKGWRAVFGSRAIRDILAGL